MAGFENSVLVTKNVNFDYTSNPPHSGIVTADGQLLIGSTANPNIAMVANTLTPGSGISITNGPGTIKIALSGSGVAVQHLTGNSGGQLSPDGSNNFNIVGSGGVSVSGVGSTLTITNSQQGFTWTDVTTATQTLAAENGYITDRGGGVTYTLPASGALGDTFKIVGKAGIATITPLALQQLLIGSASGTVGITGTAVSTNVGDCIEFVCITSGTSAVWRAVNFVGNWTLN